MAGLWPWGSSPFWRRVQPRLVWTNATSQPKLAINWSAILKKTLPFEVGSSRVWDDHLAFFDKSQPIRKGTRYRTGLVFTESGQPFKTEARSRKIAEKISRLSACKLVSHSFQPGKPSRVEYACKLAN
ncbi:hypothetical protein LCL97_18630 [Seohaeicola saemankumensis]|nr:hypothetical protein [Seohaeicola saemankumensis]MCA0872851.1 hypothetical protein [Seohaeicola saemankumensis]